MGPGAGWVCKGLYLCMLWIDPGGVGVYGKVGPGRLALGWLERDTVRKDAWSGPLHETRGHSQNGVQQDKTYISVLEQKKIEIGWRDGEEQEKRTLFVEVCLFIISID
jgi:hypothetical protein